MRIPYRAAQIALYGSGDEFIISTGGGRSRLIAFDQKAVVSINWTDDKNIGCLLSISVNKNEFLKILRKGKPRNGFYELRTDEYNKRVFVMDSEGYENAKEIKNITIGSTVYSDADCNQFNWCYAGLVVDQSIMTGSVSIDFDRFRQVQEFLHNFITVGRFKGEEDMRIVNFLAVNGEFPLVIQAFLRINARILCDLDVAVYPYLKKGD